ncbi:glycosyltransferase [Paenibacillus sp. NPDC057967]|uniref:glycosyltransferase n=1 Tax=Paenibacillus sp. NPDC057967 TaxID=3346293 RepID=UPI0036DE3B09
MNHPAIVIEVHFNSIYFSDNIYKQDWIDYRMKLTMDYTVRSFIGQSDTSFHAFIYFMDGTEALIHKALQPYPPLPSHIQFVPISERGARVGEAIQGSERAYVARTDSDNMFSLDYVERLRAYAAKSTTEVIITQHGYLYDCTSHRMATVTYRSPSFFAFLYNTQDYLAGKRYAVKTHNDAINYKYELLGGRNYVVVIHQSNELLRFKVKSSELIEPSQVDALLSLFKV